MNLSPHHANSGASAGCESFALSVMKVTVLDMSGEAGDGGGEGPPPARMVRRVRKESGLVASTEQGETAGAGTSDGRRGGKRYGSFVYRDEI